MAHRGRKRKTIAQDLGVHPTTLRRWLKHYHARGLGGLQIRWAPGQPGRIPETLAPTIQAWVKDGPQSCGLDRANWTYEELATHLYRTTGIEVKRTAMRVFCQRHDMRPYRPTYRYLRGNPEKQQAAQAELATLKKSAGRGVRVAESRRSPLSTRSDAPRHPRREGVPAPGGDMG
jgi:transposase